MVVHHPANRWQLSKLASGSSGSWPVFDTTVSLPPASMDSILALIPKIPCHDAINQTIGLRVEGRKLSLRGRERSVTINGRTSKSTAPK